MRHRVFEDMDPNEEEALCIEVSGEEVVGAEMGRV
jgi:hypothetical protein